MTMNDFLTIILSGAAGAVLGVVFFGGLWWTVQRGTVSPRPAAWFICSLVLRMIIVLPGFYFVGGGDLKRLAACLVGFVLARVVVMRWTQVPAENIKEVRHAS
jgi:F1F0 ATPase subunit 2